MKINEALSTFEIKADLRKQFLDQRKHYSAQHRKQARVAEKKICSLLAHHLDQRSFHSIMFYYPHAGEVPLLSLAHRYWQGRQDRQGSSSQKTILFPRVKGVGKMVAVAVTGEDELVPGFNGIAEPREDSYLGSVDVVLVPGLAFRVKEKMGLFRLGYGGGYYDRFLEYHPRAHKIGVFYHFQQTHIDFYETHDIGLDMIITEEVSYVTSTV